MSFVRQTIAKMTDKIAAAYQFASIRCCWLVGFVALRPKSTAMVIAGRSVNLTTLFPGQA